jgi:hypothetical protein
MTNKKVSTSTIWTIGIILVVLAFSTYIITKNNPSSEITEELAKCIGQNSELYTQTGCPACERQEELFGEYLKHINSINCFLTENRQLCINKKIEATPTWIINEKYYKGVQTINSLKDLTDC